MRITVVLSLFIQLVIMKSVFSSDLPPGFIEQEIATGLNPVSITKGLNNTIYITEKNGKVRVVQNDVLLPSPLLDVEVNDFNERGLISIALHPDFFNNGYYYAYYCPKNRNKNRVVRFTATNNGRSTLPGSEVLLIELDTLVGGIHNGGCLKFGSDGKLYIGTGEGGVATNSKLLTNTLGKILRINDDGSIPTDNPFFNDPTVTGINKSIYAYGLRNPFAFEFDATGQLYTTDVGGSTAEEINKILPGKFYGWPDREGNSGSTSIANYQGPEYFYTHQGGACAIIGCSFYNPLNKTFPAEYTGQIFFGDYCTEKIYAWDPVTKIRTDFATGANRPLWYLFADNGDMYYVERNGADGGSAGANTVSYDGKLWKIKYTNSNEVFINQNPQSSALVVGENTFFTITAYSNLQPLTYQWYKNGVLLEGATNDTLLVKSVTIADNNAIFECVVSNSVSSITSTEATLTVIQNTRPVPMISSPLANFKYKANDVLKISGTATDAEDGVLSGASLSFWVDLHHDTHTHPALAPTTGTSLPISFTVPNNGETSPNVFFRVYLKATDSKGFSSTTFTDVHPQLVGITVNSNVPEAKINYDGTYHLAGETIYSVKGIIRSLEAPLVISTNNRTCIFTGWAHGESSKLITFATPNTDVNLYASYDCDEVAYTGDGLTGTYSDVASVNINADGVRLKRVDPEINFNWQYDSPDMGTIDDNNFKAIWDGYIDIPAAGTYTFYLNSFYNDYCKLYIDNQEIINKTSGDYTGVEYFIEKSGNITFNTAGKKKIKVTFEETDWVAAIELLWSGPSITKQIVPQNNLFTNTNITTGNGLTASYLGDVASLSGISPKYTQTDTEIDFNWAAGSPNESLLGNDLYTITWKGYLRPPLEDNYTFTVNGDDGFMLLIDNDTIINQWHDGIIENKEKTIHLKGRTFYPFEFRYYENGGNANIKLQWASSLISKTGIEKKYLYTDMPAVTSNSESLSQNILNFKLARDGSGIRLLSQSDYIEKFDIFNVNGKKIISGTNEIQNQWIDMNNYSDGMYLIQIIDKGRPAVIKFIK
ncbi:PQQ-dependent sugar dehydrogenase [Sporocytophaga myxococcoides]|nr:PQQ-dependent sugar dehydrogenase [Sporocytophaga myxococcoides]